MASLEDIATEAGVSVPLVSEVLNGRLGATDAGEQTIETIRRIARELGYVHDEATTALPADRQSVVVVLVHRFGATGSGLSEAVIDGIAAACRPHGLRLQLVVSTESEEFRQYIDQAQPSDVDGLILCGVRYPELADPMLAAQRRGVPVITAHSAEIDPNIPNAGCDSRAIGRIATRHLIEAGCHDIIHICGRPERDEGYREALLAAGLPYRQEMVAEVSGYDHEAGAVAVEHFDRLGIEFNGVVADSDQQAMGAMRALFRMDRRVPLDVRVIGVDDSPFCECTIVSLSSVSTCCRERGELAVNMLFGLRKGIPARSVAVQPQLRVRESSR